MQFTHPVELCFIEQLQSKCSIDPKNDNGFQSFDTALQPRVVQLDHMMCWGFIYEFKSQINETILSLCILSLCLILKWIKKELCCKTVILWTNPNQSTSNLIQIGLHTSLKDSTISTFSTDTTMIIQ